MAIAGHVSRAMMERYSHIRMEAKRDCPSCCGIPGSDLSIDRRQFWSQLQHAVGAYSLPVSGQSFYCARRGQYSRLFFGTES